MYKFCHTCWVDKLITNFNKRKTPRKGYYKNCKECIRNEYLKKTYNITLEEFKTFLKIQGGCCYTCKINGENLVVDHDHISKNMRCLICHLCNKSLGFFKDSITSLLRAVRYLDRPVALGYTQLTPLEIAMADLRMSDRRVRKTLKEYKGQQCCGACGTWKNMDEFYINSSCSTGYHSECKVCAWEKSIWRKYRITVKIYRCMFRAQEGSCAICIQGHTEENKLVIDHCHKIGRVRGLLCNNCNAGLGQLREGKKTVKQLISYLKQDHVAQLAVGPTLKML